MDALISPRRRTLLLGALGTAALAACQRPGSPAGTQRLHLTGETMGSTFNVKLDPAGQPAERLQEAVSSALRVGRRAHVAVPARVRAQRLQPGRRRRAGSDVAGALRGAGRRAGISRWSDGAFDVTVAPAVETWGFGRDKQRRVPAAEQVAVQRGKVDWRALPRPGRTGPPARGARACRSTSAASPRGTAWTRSRSRWTASESRTTWSKSAARCAPGA